MSRVGEFEFTAFSGEELLVEGDKKLSSGDTFTVPFSATTEFSVLDNDSRLSGDSWRNDVSADRRGQLADIEVDGELVQDDVRIFAEEIYIVRDADGNRYKLVEIEVERSSSSDQEDFFTFLGDVPHPETELTVVGSYNVRASGVRYEDLSAGFNWTLDEGGSVVIEAEDLKLSGYRVDDVDAASGGDVIRLRGREGEASLKFGAESGNYNLDLAFIDENDGEGTIEVLVNGVVVQTIELVANNNGDGGDDSTISTLTIANLDLNQGDEIVLRGTRDDYEFARIDALTFTLNVDVNSDPTVAAPLEATANEDDATFTVDLLAGAFDVDEGDVLNVANVAGLVDGVTLEGNTLVVDPSVDAFQSLAEGETLDIAVSFDIIDGNGGSVPQTAAITITGTNDDPVVAAPLEETANEDDAAFTVDLLAGAFDVDEGDVLNVANVAGLVDGVTLEGNTLVVDPSVDAFQALATGESLTVTVSFDIVDGNGGSVPQTATITIIGEDDGPNIITGTEFDDFLPGTSGDDIIFGLAGNDFLNGTGGNDTLDGGEGAFDFADFFNASSAVTASLNTDDGSGGTGIGQDGDGSTDEFVSLEGIFGSVFDDSLTLTGSNGGTLEGFDGNDTLTGSDGIDNIFGGTGDDILIAGNSFDNLNGGAGNDTIIGGTDGGNDRVAFTGAIGNVTVTLDTDTGSGQTAEFGDGFGTTDTFTNIEEIAAAAFDDTITLTGSGGGVVLAEGGNDVVTGSDGNDFIAGGEGTDIINANGGVDTIFTDGGDDIVNAGEGDDFIFNGSGNSTIIIEENSGNDTIFDFEVGADQLSIQGGQTILSSTEVDTDGNGILDTTLTFSGGGSATLVDVNGIEDTNVLLDQPIVVTTGIVVDGFILGATVFGDANGNGELDAGEASATTDSAGAFALANSSGDLVAVGGTDISTGLPLRAPLKAPEGSTAITPISTLVTSLVALGQSVDEAVALVGEAFGIDPSVDILNTDPIASTIAGDPAGEVFFANIGLVQNTVVQISSLLEGTGSVDFETASNAAFDQLAQLIAAGPVNLGDPVTVETLIEQTATSVAANVDVVASGAASVIAETNVFVQQVLDGALTGEALLTELAQVGIVAQGDIADALSVASQTGTPEAIESVVNDFTGAALETAISGAEEEVGDVDGGIQGTSGADTIFGTINGDAVSGLGGDDFIDGSFGSDVLAGDSGNDVLDGGGGNDVLLGGAGSDSLFGGLGDDDLFGGDGDDFLAGGQGTNLLDGGDGNDIIDIEGDFSTFGVNTVIGGAGNDAIGNVGATSSDIVDAGSGDDSVQISLFGSSQFDPVTFETVAVLPEVTLGSGSDSITLLNVVNDGVSFTTVTDFDPTVDVIDIESILSFGLFGFDGSSNPFGSGFLRLIQDGTDTLFQVDAAGSGDNFQTQLKLQNVDVDDLTDANFTTVFSIDGSEIAGAIIDGTEGDDFLTGTVAGDTINGFGGNDVLDGGGGNDVLLGGAGADTLSGGLGDDDLFGGDGDDFLAGGQGTNLLDGGDGNDIIDIEGDFSTFGVNTVIGGAGNDAIGNVGATSSDIVDAGSGDDSVLISLFGSSQFDPVTFETVAVLPEVTLGSGSDTITLLNVVNDGVSFTTVTDFDPSVDVIDIEGILNFGLFGFDGSSNPFGSGFLRLIQDGTDTLFQVDSIGSGDNFQTQLKLQNVNVDDLTDANFTTVFSIDGSEIVGAIIDGTEGDDFLTGTVAGDTINGFGGNDFLDGGGGNDVLLGGAGADTLSGGLGDDDLFGGDGDDFLAGGQGTNLLDGGDGNDIIDIEGDFSTFGVNTVIGGAGNDAIGNVGATSSDIVDAGSGDDSVLISLFGSSQFDPVTFETVAVLPEVTLGSGSDTITLLNVVNDGVSFTTVTDFDPTVDVIDIESILNFGLFGFDGSSNPFGSGFLRLVQDGTDTLFQVDAAGSGDNFQTQLKLQNVNVDDLTDANFLANVAAGIGFSPDGSGITGETLEGTSASDVIDGTIGDDIISGLAGDDTLSGGNGVDQIDGGEGADTIIGGFGNDVITGGAGNDIINADGGADTIIVGANSGDDTILDFEVGADQLSLQDGQSILSTTEVDADGNGTLDTLISFSGGGSVTLVDLNGIDNLDALFDQPVVGAVTEPSAGTTSSASVQPETDPANDLNQQLAGSDDLFI